MQNQNKYLLDSNVIIDFLRGEERAVNFIASMQTPTISVVSVGEVYQGAINTKELKKTKDIIDDFKVLYITEKVSKEAAGLVEKYHLASGLFFLDGLIAATAIEHDLIILTTNIKRFKMIKGLKVEKWRDD